MHRARAEKAEEKAEEQSALAADASQRGHALAEAVRVAGGSLDPGVRGGPDVLGGPGPGAGALDALGATADRLFPPLE